MFYRNKLKKFGNILYSSWKKTFKHIYQLSCFVGHPVYTILKTLAFPTLHYEKYEQTKNDKKNKFTEPKNAIKKISYGKCNCLLPTITFDKCTVGPIQCEKEEKLKVIILRSINLGQDSKQLPNNMEHIKIVSVQWTTIASF